MCSSCFSLSLSLSLSSEFDRPETPVVVELPDWRTIAEEDYLNLDEDTRRRVDEQQAMDKKQERLRK